MRRTPRIGLDSQVPIQGNVLAPLCNFCAVKRTGKQLEANPNLPENITLAGASSLGGTGEEGRVRVQMAILGCWTVL